MKAKYDAIVNLWETYRTQIKCEFKNRELDKWDSFDKSKLNIKLGHFSGYDSPVNIYDFKSDFLKLYEKSVPFDVQADLLKNNYLEKEALTLVKNISDVKEMSRRFFQTKSPIWQVVRWSNQETPPRLASVSAKSPTSYETWCNYQLTIILRKSCTTVTRLIRLVIYLVTKDPSAATHQRKANGSGDSSLSFWTRRSRRSNKEPFLQSKTKRSDQPANPATKRRSGHHTSSNQYTPNTPM